MKRFSEWQKDARIMGLSDAELDVLGKLMSAADEWSQQMAHCANANNFNGTLHRAIQTARVSFGYCDLAIDLHRHCDWKCVAMRGLPRCARDQPTTHCRCGIEYPSTLEQCPTCYAPKGKL